MFQMKSLCRKCLTQCQEHSVLWEGRPHINELVNVIPQLQVGLNIS